MLYACDEIWWNQYFPEVGKGFKGGELWTVSSGARDRYGINWIFGYDAPGLSDDEKKIHTGLNSGYQAIGLAVHFGIKRILLLGFDFQRTGGKTHWHGDHPRGLGNGGTYANWRSAMTRLAEDASLRGIEIVNCSRVTSLTCFRRSTINAELPDTISIEARELEPIPAGH